MKRFHGLIFDSAIILTVLMAIILASCRSAKTATECTSEAVQKSEVHTSFFEQLQMFSSLSFDSLIISMKPGIERSWKTKGIQPDTAATPRSLTAEGDTVLTDSLDYNRHPPESSVSPKSRPEPDFAGQSGTAEIKLYGLRKSAGQTDTKVAEVQQADSMAHAEIRDVFKDKNPKYNVFLLGYFFGIILTALLAILIWFLFRKKNKNKSQ